MTMVSVSTASHFTHAAKGNTGVPPVLASGHPDRCKSLVGGTPATRHSRDGHVPLHEKAVAPDTSAVRKLMKPFVQTRTNLPLVPAEDGGWVQIQ